MAKATRRKSFNKSFKRRDRVKGEKCFENIWSFISPPSFIEILKSTLKMCQNSLSSDPPPLRRRWGGSFKRIRGGWDVGGIRGEGVLTHFQSYERIKVGHVSSMDYMAMTIINREWIVINLFQWEHFNTGTSFLKLKFKIIFVQEWENLTTTQVALLYTSFLLHKNKYISSTI